MDNKDRPAFASQHSIDGNWVKEPLEQFRGITKREYFAAMAMQGIMAAVVNPEIGNPQYEEKKLAYHAIAMADEILKQLES